MNERNERQWFEDAVGLPRGEREAFLERSIPDPALRQRVRRLLEAHDTIERSASGFLETPLQAAAVPASVGPYWLLEQVGAGGMGEVYLAEQSEPVRRRVAVKLLRSTLAGPDVLARFDVERQTLALLEHPNVARILDAGATDEGRPYVVVEYVSGLPLTRHCDQHRLSLQERLDLFLDVCAGVQHAHQRGIIHRDLKPSNVLVAEVDGAPTPKIIDFGIAKAVSAGAPGSAPHTRVGQIVGTPDYMSPEQAEVAPLDVDIRSDVYSLGVILCELLTGELPYESIEPGANALQIAQRIAAREPARPSVRVQRDPTRLADAARSRSTSPRELVADLRGDLDWIVLKALEADRRRRYGSVAELADDLRRLRRMEPIVARPPDPAYLASRFVRRNRLPVAVATSLFAALAVFSVLMTEQARETARERDRAEAEAETARQVSQFLVETLQAADPEKHLGVEPTARKLLDDSARRLDQSLTGQPAAKAQLEQAFGEVYHLLGEYPVALEHFQRALAIQESLDPPDERGRLTALRFVGRALGQLGRVEESEAATQDVLARTRRAFGEMDRLHVDAVHDLGVIRHMQGRYAEALELYDKAWRSRERLLGPTHVLTATAQTNVAVIRQLLGQLAESERVYLEVIERMVRAHGDDNPQAIIARFNLSTLYSTQGDYARALELQQRIVPQMRRIYGADHPYTLNAAGNLAATLSNLGRYQESYAQNAEIVRSLVAKRGMTHQMTLFFRANLAYDKGRMGERDAALHDLEAVIEQQRRQLGPEHRDTVSSQTMLAHLRRQWGEHAAAVDVLERTLPGSRAGLGDRHDKTREILLMLADSAFAVGDDQAADRWIREGREAGADLSGDLSQYPELRRRREAGQLAT